MGAMKKSVINLLAVAILLLVGSQSTYAGGPPASRAYIFCENLLEESKDLYFSTSNPSGFHPFGLAHELRYKENPFLIAEISGEWLWRKWAFVRPTNAEIQSAVPIYADFIDDLQTRCDEDMTSLKWFLPSYIATWHKEVSNNLMEGSLFVVVPYFPNMAAIVKNYEPGELFNEQITRTEYIKHDNWIIAYTTYPRLLSFKNAAAVFFDRLYWAFIYVLFWIIGFFE